MTTVSPPQSATNSELIRWAFQVLNQHDVTPLKQFWTSATTVRFPERTVRGPEEIAQYFEDAFNAVPDFHMEVLATTEEGDDVFVHWHLTGTHQGPLLGIEATGKKLEIDGMDHFILRDGKVASNFVVYDQMQYARQIGMMPPDGSPADKAMKGAFNLRTKIADSLSRRRT